MKKFLQFNKLSEPCPCPAVNGVNSSGDLPGKVFLYLIVLTFFFGYTLPLNPTSGNWYQQWMPSPLGGQLRDMTFVDSLTGFAVSDSSILKTTNGGDNWAFKLTGYYFLRRIQFINSNSGFACGGLQIFKTQNVGENWTSIPLPGITADDMSAWNQDTLWIASSALFAPGVFRTTNGGVNWTQYPAGRPNKIYMYNSRIGFVASSDVFIGFLKKTTDGGQNWFSISDSEGFWDIKFVDSLVGWRTWYSINGSDDTTMKKTTDGGITWLAQHLPINLGPLGSFSMFNKDTLIGIGGHIVYPNNQVRGVLFKTVNGGTNWGYQIPDTAIHIPGYNFMKFFNKKNGWCYNGSLNPATGIHTTNGGDTTIIYGIQKISNKVPLNFELYQNYPNPFNPNTVIGFKLKVTGLVNIKIFDITGKLASKPANQKLSEGEYKINFYGNGLSSGVYFYSLFIDNKLIDTKKMILFK